MIRRAYHRRGLGAITPSFCQSLISGQISYVPPSQKYRDAMIAECAALGVDIRQAAGLLPAQFTADNAENPYYTAYKETAAATNVGAGEHVPIAMNPDTPVATTQQLTSLPVYQGSAAWNPPPIPEANETAGTAPAAGTPPAAASNPPAETSTEVSEAPGGTIPADGREVVGGSLVDEVISALPPELQEIAQKFRHAAGAIPWWLWVAAIGAAYYYVRGKKRRR